MTNNDSAMGHSHSETEGCEVITPPGVLGGTSLSCLLPLLLLLVAQTVLSFVNQVIIVRTVFRLRVPRSGMSCKYLLLVENACISEMHALCCCILILRGASEDAMGENATDGDNHN